MTQPANDIARDAALPGVRALVFDVFGTVVDWRSGLTRDAAAFLGHCGADPDRAPAFADAWDARANLAMEEVRQGRRPYTRASVLFRKGLDALLPEYGIEPARVPAASLDELVLAWQHLDPWPDAVAGLTRLRARYALAALSNGNIAVMLHMARRAGLPWDAILGAELAQTYKPMPAVYVRAAEALEMAPHELCLVAAHNGDLAAARRCGLRTAFLPRPLEHGPGQTSDLKPEADWDVVADDLADLAARLTGAG